jgi:hypothetical protein
MATVDKIKILKINLKDAKAVEKDARGEKTRAEKTLKDNLDPVSSKLYTDAARTWAKAVVSVGRATDKLEAALEESQSQTAV